MSLDERTSSTLCTQSRTGTQQLEASSSSAVVPPPPSSLVVLTTSSGFSGRSYGCNHIITRCTNSNIRNLTFLNFRNGNAWPAAPVSYLVYSCEPL